MAAEAYAEAVELIETFWIRYANTWRYDTVLAWLRQLPDEVLTSEVHLLLIQAWVLSLSARQEEAARAIAAIERLGDLGAGPLRDGFSSAGASLTMLRAGFPGEMSAPSWNMPDGRLSSRAQGRLGDRWRAGRLAWACTSRVSVTRPTSGSRSRRRWRPRAPSGCLARRRWPIDR